MLLVSRATALRLSVSSGRTPEGRALAERESSCLGASVSGATYACRLGPPLCFNYLKLLHEKDAGGLFQQPPPEPTTYFSQTIFGEMDRGRSPLPPLPPLPSSRRDSLPTVRCRRALLRRRLL